MICWTNIIIKPKPNSTADKIRKKNVKDNILRLSKIKPINKHNMYNVIHNNSAVNNKCSAVFTFKAILVNIIKKITKTKFKSPKTIIYI